MWRRGKNSVCVLPLSPLRRLYSEQSRSLLKSMSKTIRAVGIFLYITCLPLLLYMYQYLHNKFQQPFHFALRYYGIFKNANTLCIQPFSDLSLHEKNKVLKDMCNNPIMMQDKRIQYVFKFHSRFGSKCLRIFRVLLLKKHLEQKQVNASTYDCRNIKIVRQSLIEIQ